MMGIVIIPLNFQGQWIDEKFSGRPQNNVTFSAQGMNVSVSSSASPLLYPFEQVKRIVKFEVEGEFKGLPKLKDPSLQGSKDYDDYPLRIGLIIDGEMQLTGLKKAFAPEWIKKIYESLRGEQGIDHIEFYNVTQNLDQLKTTRTHFASKLLKENFFAHVAKPEKFNYSVTLDKPQRVRGLWISIDGDDTKSNYEVRINKLTLTTD